MNYQTAADIMNQLVRIAKPGVPLSEDIDESYRSFGAGKNSIAFIGSADHMAFDQKIGKLYQANKQINETYSYKSFETDVVNIIYNAKSTEKKITSSEVENFFNKILAIECIESEVVRELFGAKLDVPKITLGDFTIYNPQLSIDYFSKQYKWIVDSNPDLLQHILKAKVLISIKVNTRETGKSYELTDNYFHAFENVINYVIADIQHEHRIGIFNFSNPLITRAFCLSAKRAGAHRDGIDPFVETDLSKAALINTDLGYDLVWPLITKTGKSSFEQKLLNSIEWIGKAVQELDPAKSLYQFVIAVEALLQYDEGKMVNPSIANHISESVAFIISEIPEERQAIFRGFKKLYAKRSDIAHGGTTNITIHDLFFAWQVSKSMIIAMLTKDQLKSLTNINMVNEWITIQKFK